MSDRLEVPADIESVAPLSPMQEGMLFHTLLEPHSGIYLMQNRYRLEGEIDARTFVAAWEMVVERHAALRTSLVWKRQKRPLQVTHKHVRVPFDVLDWRRDLPDVQRRQLDEILQAELETGFDFARAPLLHFRLIRTGERNYEFVHSFHHIVLDEWCTSLVMMDFLTCYEALVRGKTPHLPAARPFRDYIDWLARQDRALADAFWRDYLRDWHHATPLGLSSALQDGQNGVEDLAAELSPAASAALTALSARHRLTLNTIFQGAWAILLHRLSGQSDVVFGVTVAGRPPELPGVESIVGLFINTLPLRVNVRQDAKLLPWLAQLVAQNLRLRDFEYSPLVEIQRQSEVASGQELFASLLVFENGPIDPALQRVGAFQVKGVADRVHTNYPLTVMGWPGEQVGVKVSYDRAQIKRADAQRVLGHLCTLLEAMAARPDARLGDYSLLAPAEQRRALLTWNPPCAAPIEFSSYAARLHAQVARTPHAVVARCGDRQLTYRELDHHANALALALHQRGITTEHKVVVFDDRDLEWLTMAVAVFKAGAAYVPLDVAYPDERCRQILALSQPSAVLCRATNRSRIAAILEALPNMHPVILTYEEEDQRERSSSRLPDRGHPFALAYVIYTSGSTGAPKGVMVESAGMLNNMLTKIPRLGLQVGDVIAQSASPCFDISIWQLLTAPLFGGIVDILPATVVRDPERLLHEVQARKVTVLEVVPALLGGMLDVAQARGEGQILAHLRWVLPTGEALPMGLVRAWLRRFPTIGLINAYGPAECSDDVALHAITTMPPADDHEVAIGRPVDNLRLYVLDPTLSPLPIGVSGELVVGGLGVGRGYLGDPRRTAEAFIPDPFAQDPGQRLYRTGDLARYRDDGVLDFVGRRDHQVKIRGFRIELGEIEAHLTNHPDVGQAAVIVREDQAGARRLVAYVAAPESIAITDLRGWLQIRLPEYMVPHAWVVLSALPRTPNGKIDRSRLPVPATGPIAKSTRPLTPTEEVVRGIWHEVLGIAESEIDVEASFFALGGHSLLLTQVLARVRRHWAREVPLRALFDAPTLAAQAEAIDGLQNQEPAPSLVLLPLLAQPSEGPQPLSFAQERLWFLAQLDPSATSYNVPAAVLLRGPLDADLLGRCLHNVIARHDALRTRFAAIDGRALAVVERELLIDFPLIDLTTVPVGEREEKARACLEHEASRPFDLTSLPLIRAMLVRLQAEEHLLLVVLHHIVADGWSMNVLVAEVSEHYDAALTKRENTLPALPIQYADWARWQREWLTSEVMQHQLTYWRQRLGDRPPVLVLPCDYPRDNPRSFRGARQVVAFDPALSKLLRQRAREHGATIFAGCTAAFSAWLGRLTGYHDLCLGTPVAQRTRPELEGLIGFLVNTVVLRIDLDGDPTFSTLLGRVREETVAAQAHQDVPFERLVQALRPTRDLHATPLFQVMFSLQESQRPLQAAAGLELLPYELEPGSAQFDLSLHLILEGDELSGWFEYSTDLFAAATVENFVASLLDFFRALAQTPSLPLSALPFHTPVFTGPAAKSAASAVASPDEVPVLRDLAWHRHAQAELARIWANVLGRSAIADGDNFFELGGDSILSLHVVAQAQQAGLRLSARQMFQHQTLAALAAAALPLSSFSPDIDAMQVPDGSEVPLLPIAHAFFQRKLSNPHHHNQSLLLLANQRLAWAAVQAACHALIRRHDALRLRFEERDGRWRQIYGDAGDGLGVHRVDLAKYAHGDLSQVLASQTARWQASLDLQQGPLFRVILFDCGGIKPDRLLLVAHHLMVDGVSWQILLDDFAFALAQAMRDEVPTLPLVGGSFYTWARHLQNVGEEPGLQAEAATWLAMPWHDLTPTALILPVDVPEGQRLEAFLATVTVALSETQTTALLQTVSLAYRTRVEEVLLAALARTLSPWTQSRALLVDLESHGRHEIGAAEVDLSRTVGWLTNIYPVVLVTNTNDSLSKLLIDIKEQMRRVPRHGLAYGLVRELGAGITAQRLRDLPASPIAFNYLGQWDQALGDNRVFAIAPESAGPGNDANDPLAYELEIEAAVYQRRLEATFRYSSSRFHGATIEDLAERWLKHLIEVIDHCLAPGAGAYSPADFPDVVLASDELDVLLAQMDG